MWLLFWIVRIICGAVLGLKSGFFIARLKFERERFERLNGAVLEEELVERHVRFGVLHLVRTDLGRSGIDGQKLPILLLEDHITDVARLRCLQVIIILHLDHGIGCI